MVSLVEAYRNKYEEIPENSHTTEVHGVQVFVPKSHVAKGTIPAGRLAMDDLQIDTVGEVEDNLVEMFAKIKELDLTKNTISDWREVEKIMRVIPHLELLNLTLNPLTDTSFSSMSANYPHLHTFILNATNCSWHVISQLLQYVPRLQELHISMNRYTSVDLPDNLRHTALLRLFMNDSNIEDWDEICKLGRVFPNLKALNVINSNIKTLRNGENGRNFGKLTYLNIGGCDLCSWLEMDKLMLLPVLDHLRISRVPFLEALESKPRRQQLIARLPGLKKLNGSRITETEREDAERAFVRLYVDNSDPPNRYYELEEKYGKLDPLVHVDLTPNSTLSMLIRYEDKTTLMVVNLLQTVNELKSHLQQFTGLSTTQQRLFYNEMFDGQIKDSQELRLPNKKLLSLNIKEGDEFEVLRK